MKMISKILVALILLMNSCTPVYAAITANKLYNNQTTGSNVNTWGITLNSNFTTIDNNLGGTLTLSVAGNSNVTLTSAQAQNLIYDFTGVLTGNINVVFPAQGGFYYVNNQTTGSFTLTIKATTSTGIVVPQGNSALIIVDNSTSPPTLLAGSTAASSLTGTTLASSVVNSSLTSFGASPSFTTPTLGVALATSINGVTIPVTTDTTALLGTVESFTKTQSVTPSAITISTSTFTPVSGNSNSYNIQLVHASCPCTIANPSGTIVPGTDLVLTIQQSATGSDTISAWGSYYKFSGGTAPTLSTAASNTDVVSCHVWSSTDLFCGFVGNFTP